MKRHKYCLTFYKTSILFCFLLFRVAPTAYGSFQTRGQMQLPAYATAAVKPYPSCICNLHHSSQQCQIPEPLSEARDQTCILMDTSGIHFCCTTMGTPYSYSYKYSFSLLVQFHTECDSPPFSHNTQTHKLLKHTCIS